MRHNDGDRCDIVIPVWDNLELTRDCINSIFRHTAYPYRLVIIDNACDAPTRKFLEDLRQKNADKVIILRNDINNGFVKAVNQGMRYSDAAYICIMNNDTIVTDGWLDEMIGILRANSDIGIINPSSNTSCQFPGDLGLDAYADTLRKYKGQYQELYTGRAFAMIVKRDAIDRVGYLDESYGMGYFDDTDYCKRVQAAGFKTVRAKASYVYHKESQSFSKIKEKNDIFVENEKKFASKWGRYLRIAYILPFLRDKGEREEISSNINKIARSGHQVWIFTSRQVGSQLNLIDHESIRFLFYSDILFDLVAFYKIWKRRRKKRLDLLLTNSDRISRIYGGLKNFLGADIYSDNDFQFIENKLNKMSRSLK